MKYGSKEHCAELAAMPDTSNDPDWLRERLYEYMNRVETLQARVEALEARRDWINTDISYKAPEQITAQLFGSYLDMIFGDLAATEQEGET